jgi:hypothetical protein
MEKIVKQCTRGVSVLSCSPAFGYLSQDLRKIVYAFHSSVQL